MQRRAAVCGVNLACWGVASMGEQLYDKHERIETKSSALTVKHVSICPRYPGFLKFYRATSRTSTTWKCKGKTQGILPTKADQIKQSQGQTKLAYTVSQEVPSRDPVRGRKS